jgi:large subunit ribosomal protein L21e
MARAGEGFRSGTRRKLKKRLRDKFKPEQYLQRFREGERVVLKLEPASHKGMPHPRFKGKVGEVIGKRGSAYIVRIMDRKKPKEIISRPEHLKRV